MSEGKGDDNDDSIEMWKVKKLIKQLTLARGCVLPCLPGVIFPWPFVVESWDESEISFLFLPRFLLMETADSGPPTVVVLRSPFVRRPSPISCVPDSNGTSMISLIVPPKDQISRVSKMLTDEYGTASNIKSRVNRLSVLSAITSTQQRLKLYNRVPDNGLILYCGSILTEEGKEKKVNIDFEPFKPINTSLYLCDNKFHTEALGELLEQDDCFGFIVMDGNGCLFGTLSGSTRRVMHKFSVDLPKKHGRGGQSALRFARLRLEKRHNYVRKVAETATQLFVPDGMKPNIAGLVLAGSAEFKHELNGSDLFDQRLAKIVLKLVDVSYGGENGFNQAIELSAEALANVKFVQEKKLISSFFDEISQDTGKFCFGVSDTLKALELGAVKTLVVYENLEIMRYEIKNNATGEVTVKHLTKEQQADPSHFHDKETGVELEVEDKITLLEYVSAEGGGMGSCMGLQCLDLLEAG